MALQLVVFDCDGVLVDSERLVVAVEARILTELGWPLTPQQVADRWMGRSSAYQLADLEARIGAEAARRFDELSTQEALAVFERELAAVPGVEAVLDALDAAGTLTCVASSGSHTKMQRTLGRTGLYDRFHGRIFSADEVAHGKPEPDLFLHAARRMGVSPAGCAVVEDSVYGVRAGVAAGMRVLGYAGGLTSAAALRDAGAEVFADMADLTPLLLADLPSASCAPSSPPTTPRSTSTS
ncbi:MAG TPA: HAD family hydrolase [Nocardioidaceae bacterium]|jgi:HAD superfamily hydrolase (TIGR01509 family)|nr:HAD family hydrolase [Nocardioidaceae bacterium]